MAKWQFGKMCLKLSNCQIVKSKNHKKKDLYMAKFETSAGIDSITGKFNKYTCLTMRQKTWHYPDGRVFGYGPKEVYSQEKRDYKKSPRSAAEQAQYERWVSVCKEASLLTKDMNHPRYAELASRHIAQLCGTPDRAVGKRICQFGNFVRAVLASEKRAE